MQVLADQLGRDSSALDGFDTSRVRNVAAKKCACHPSALAGNLKMRHRLTLPRVDASSW